jgi:L-cysteine/cystine lyase
MLYVAAAAAERIRPVFAGHGAFESFDELGAYTTRATGQRFEIGGVFRPTMLALAESVRWIMDDVTLDWAHVRIAEMAAYCRQALEGIEGVDIITPAGRQAGLVNFTYPGWEPAAVVEELADRRIIIRGIGRPVGLRVSTGFYNTEEEVDRLVAALRELQGVEPHAPRLTLH